MTSPVNTLQTSPLDTLGLALSLDDVQPGVRFALFNVYEGVCDTGYFASYAYRGRGRQMRAEVVFATGHVCSMNLADMGICRYPKRTRMVFFVALTKHWNSCVFTVAYANRKKLPKAQPGYQQSTPPVKKSAKRSPPSSCMV